MAVRPASERISTRVRSERIADVAVTVAAFALSVALLAVGGVDDHAGEISVVGVVLAAVGSLPLVAARKHAFAVFVVTALANIALRALADPVGPPVGPTIALFWVGATGDGSRDRMWLTLGVGIALLAGHLVAGGLGTDTFTGLLFGIVVWGGAWLAGERTRLRSERMAALEERARRAEHEAERERRLAAAEERTRIARDLHDSAGHAINVILVHAGLGRLQVGKDPEAARAAFETIEEVARETVGDIDQIVRVLREDGASTEGVEPPPGLAAVDSLVERHRAAGLDVTATIRGDRDQLTARVDRAAYRIIQEALTNAARHGDGHVEVDVTVAPEALEVVVANPLRPEPSNGSPGGGHGLIGMRERAAVLGGSVEAGARDGRFQVHASLPVAS